MNKLVGHVFPFPLEELCPLCGSDGGGGGGHTSAIGITHRQDTTQNRTGQNRTLQEQNTGEHRYEQIRSSVLW